MLSFRYRNPDYGKLPTRMAGLARVAAVLWVALLVLNHTENRVNEAAGHEFEYLRYVDRELQILEAEERGGEFAKSRLDADESEQETLVALRKTMERLADAEQDDLGVEARVCLALLQFETGLGEEALTTLGETPQDDQVARLLSELIRDEEIIVESTESLRYRVETGTDYAWEARLLSRIEGGQERDDRTWGSYHEINDSLLRRVQLSFVIDCLALLLGVICLPFAFRVLRRPTVSALPQIMSRWSTTYVLGWFFVVEVGVVLLGWVQEEALWMGNGLPSEIRYPLWLGSLLVNQGLGAVILAAVLFAHPRHALVAFRVSGRVPWSAILAILAILSLLHILASLLSGHDRIVDPSDFLSRNIQNPLGLCYTLLGSSVAAPIFEEFLYRGVLFLGLRRRLGNLGALLLSSTVFALAHSQYEWEGLLSVGVFGVSCGLLAWRTGSILPGIVLHAAYNTLIVFHVFLIYH